MEKDYITFNTQSPIEMQKMGTCIGILINQGYDVIVNSDEGLFAYVTFGPGPRTGLGDKVAKWVNRDE